MIDEKLFLKSLQETLPGEFNTYSQFKYKDLYQGNIKI